VHEAGGRGATIGASPPAGCRTGSAVLGKSAASAFHCDWRHRVRSCAPDNSVRRHRLKAAEDFVRNAVYGSVILAGLFLVPIADGRVRSAAAEEAATRIENAPCGWFTQSYPGAWGTEHRILIVPGVVIEKISFSRGTFQLADGTDASEYLEKRCGGN
jgi:hypothetical protein